MIFRESILDKKTLPGVSANGYVVKILPRIFKVWNGFDDLNTTLGVIRGMFDTKFGHKLEFFGQGV